MRFGTIITVAVAFTAGMAVSPLSPRWMSSLAASAPPARQAAPPATAPAPALTPVMIDLAALKHADLPTTTNPQMNARPLLTTPNATIGVQSGNVAKHLHQYADEIQYIIEGEGTMWLGAERKEFKPGTLVIIPRGTAHGGLVVKTGPVKAISIKIPPQPAGDSVFID